MQPLKLYSVFHLNISFSSIEEKDRGKVVKRCYWPLLRFVRDRDFPVGVELSGYTLETINSIDTGWVCAFRELLDAGTCTLVGSGYIQLIGPLVPPVVNVANLQIGNSVYAHLLGQRPSVALVNEQAFSAGIVEHYLGAGYAAILAEWDNAARHHPEWPAESRYLPQRACGAGGTSIPVIWTHAIAFQKFQRYAHGEIDATEFLAYLGQHCGESPRLLPLYSNDAEIFNYRPGRYATESAHIEGEWERIGQLIDAVKKDARFELVSLQDALELSAEPAGGHALHLESPEQPVPVKKQGKYNISRWAVTGRNDFMVNTRCHRICRQLSTAAGKDKGMGNQRQPFCTEEWKELCYLWSSDFRTHITAKRWHAYLDRLRMLEERIGCDNMGRVTSDVFASPLEDNSLSDENPALTVRREGRFLYVECPTLRVILNCRKGLAIHRLYFPGVAEEWLCGTLPHGYFDDIGWGADFFTGHFVFERPGRAKVTDLADLGTDFAYCVSGRECKISAAIPTPLGPIRKTITVGLARVAIHYNIDWATLPVGSLRYANITLNPEAFSQNELVYVTHNGGREAEFFHVNGKNIDHGSHVSSLVSAFGGVGMTEGWVALGDTVKRLRVTRTFGSAPLGMLQFCKVAGSYFCRTILSAQEVDETAREKELGNDGMSFGFVIGLGCETSADGLIS